MKDHNFRTHYQCAGCGDLFKDRYEGTLILTGLKHIRLIGPDDECIRVLEMANDESTDPRLRRSPRFHSKGCLEKWFEGIQNRLQLIDGLKKF